jgi:DNA-binding transcriptional regulator YhcF (GntR family)
MWTPVLPYTSRARKALVLSVSHALSRRAEQVRSEDLLIGLLQEERSVAVQALAHAGVTQERAQFALRTLRESSSASPRSAEPSSHEPAGGFRITIDDTSERTIFEQIVQQTQEAVATGTLSPGDRLPPVRQLADTLQIATVTVARAYAELERLGVVITDGARGTSVAPRPARVPAPDRPAALVGLLRPVVVAAFHIGAEANELRAALATAMHDIFRER